MPERADSSAARVLFLGGTGTISAACARRAARTGMAVTILNRGVNGAERDLDADVEYLTGDVTEPESLARALGSRSWDCVVNFLSYDADDALAMAARVGPSTGQYIHISSASIYSKPVWRFPITESSPVGFNRDLPYARAKLRAELALADLHRTDGFPVTIVRPSHTYDDASPPLAGGWTAVDRLARGLPIPVHGDGTSLWTLTHADDVAVGLVGLIGNPAAIGDVFNITGQDVCTWDGIYTMLADALGVEATLVHIASEMFPVAAPEWFWSGEMVGDIGHSAIFDNAKIRQAVPAFSPRLTFHRAARRIVQWRADHPTTTAADPETQAILDRLVQAHARSREAYAAAAPS